MAQRELEKSGRLQGRLGAHWRPCNHTHNIEKVRNINRSLMVAMRDCGESVNHSESLLEAVEGQ